MIFSNTRFLRKTGLIFFAFITVSVFIFSCKSRNEDDEYNKEKEDPTLSSAYEENDTLAIKTLPPNLSSWINYYQQFDSAFQLINFKASGVVLHMEEMNNSSGVTNESVFKVVTAYSPDSTKLIDFWSYLRNIEPDENGNQVMRGGGPDQEVIIADKKHNSSRQLMYNGTQQVVETADWLDNNSFVLGLVNTNETGQIWIPEIYLFNLHDSTFTNFRLNHEIKSDSILLDADFSRFWLMQKKIRLE
ncbi:hypothetical protein [Pollutibacter soli]|uniref:hypothetical protein n=1 Tax=Pollutibacter soli TaxID=3034157 RepID=UPI003013715E